MKSLEAWLRAYAVSHRRPANRVLHKICVPAILFAIVAACSLLRVPAWPAWANGAFALSLLSLVFYARLGFVPFALMLAQLALCLALALWADGALPHPLLSYAILFALAWVGQFVGHALEGKRPSFFQDLQFLLIGPLWIVLGKAESWDP